MMVDVCVQYLLEQNDAAQSAHMAPEAVFTLQIACFSSTGYCTYESRIIRVGVIYSCKDASNVLSHGMRNEMHS